MSTRRKFQQKKKAAVQDIPGMVAQAIQYHRRGALDQAEKVYRQILAVESGHVTANHYLGVIAHQAGQYNDAFRLIGKALAGDPDNAEAHYNLGIVQKKAGNLTEALESFQRTLALDPNYTDALINAGQLFHVQGDRDQATDCFRKALKLQPDTPRILFFLANSLTGQGNTEEAITCLRKAAALAPEEAEIHYHLGNLLREKDQRADAAGCYYQAIACNPRYYEAFNNLGNMYSEQGYLTKAIECFQEALSIQPDSVQALNNLNRTLNETGRVDEARDILQQILSINPDEYEAHSNFLFCLNYSEEISQQEILAESRKWDRQHSPNTVQKTIFRNSRDKERRLRIGYVSPDFFRHSVAYFFEPLLSAHNREQVETFCYANVAKPDEVTERIKGKADHWLSITGMSDESVVERIRKDRIDILVDLAGHTAGNRLPVFTRRPAPIQVSWLGYPNTTGLSAIDYRLTDDVADPAGESEKLSSEQLVRLRNGFLCYRARESAPAASPLPSLTRGYITFGSFNYIAKATPAVIELWSKILHQLPGARLLLKSKQFMDEEIRKKYRQIFADHGIAEDRLELYHWLPPGEHLALYNKVDIGLDPFPYNGTTTTCEAMWMGVPVITLRGDRHSGRVGASILNQIGLPELICQSPQEYLEKAVQLAEDQDELVNYRTDLRERMERSSLTDQNGFAREMESTYRNMWHRWCNAAQQ